MAANYVKKVGASYNFGTFEADTPIEAEFDKPVKELRVPLTVALLAGSLPEIFTEIGSGGSLKFPNVGGYPIKFIFEGHAANSCNIDVVEFGDIANEHYFDVITPEEP